MSLVNSIKALAPLGAQAGDAVNHMVTILVLVGSKATKEVRFVNLSNKVSRISVCARPDLRGQCCGMRYVRQ